jgi:predicted nucleic acid-binding protein
MTSVTLTSLPIATARLVVDTDVASFVFKWHPEFAASYVAIMRGSELVVSFMTLAEMRQGALEANWGRRKCDVLEEYLADFSVLHSDNLLCSTWAAVRNESTRKGRQMGAADAWIAATALALSVPLVTTIPRTTATWICSSLFPQQPDTRPIAKNLTVLGRSLSLNAGCGNR